MVKLAMGEAVLGKLREIAGHGKLELREYRVKSALNWRTKARSTIRHLLKGEQRPSLEEATQIEAAHFRHCAKTIEANRNENAKLFASMQSALEAMQASDPEFFASQIAAVSEILLRGRNVAGG